MSYWAQRAVEQGVPVGPLTEELRLFKRELGRTLHTTTRCGTYRKQSSAEQIVTTDLVRMDRDALCRRCGDEVTRQVSDDTRAYLVEARHAAEALRQFATAEALGRPARSTAMLAVRRAFTFRLQAIDLLWRNHDCPAGRCRPGALCADETVRPSWAALRTLYEHKIAVADLLISADRAADRADGTELLLHQVAVATYVEQERGSYLGHDVSAGYWRLAAETRAELDVLHGYDPKQVVQGVWATWRDAQADGGTNGDGEDRLPAAEQAAAHARSSTGDKPQQFGQLPTTCLADITAGDDLQDAAAAQWRDSRDAVVAKMLAHWEAGLAACKAAQPRDGWRALLLAQLVRDEFETAAAGRNKVASWLSRYEPVFDDQLRRGIVAVPAAVAQAALSQGLQVQRTLTIYDAGPADGPLAEDVARCALALWDPSAGSRGHTAAMDALATARAALAPVD